MLNLFIQSFSSIFIAVLQIFLITLFCGFAVRKQIITPDQIKAVSGLVVKIFLPCLILSNIMDKLDPSTMPLWWLIPLAGCVPILTGMLIGYLFFCRELPAKRNLLPLCCMQNAAYLSLPLVKIAYPEHFEEMSLIIFLVVLAVSPMLWSVGKALLTSHGNIRLSWQDFISPPFCSNILAILLVLSGGRALLPVCVTDAVRLLGTATIPCALLILGASLGNISIHHWRPGLDALRVLGIKLFLLPLLVVVALHFLRIRDQYPYLCIIFVIQAASAPATNFIIQVRNYGGDVEKVSGIMLLAYLLCMLTIPFWVSAWMMLG